VGRPTAPQFVTTEQLGEALRQVQEAVIRAVCEQMKIPDQQPWVKRERNYDPAFEYDPPYQKGQVVPQVELASAFEGNARSVIETKQALWKVQISVVPSRSVTTLYMSGA